jgi:hypothetical protein
MMVAVSIILLLCAIAVPYLAVARQQGKVIRCAAQLHQVGIALATYQGLHRFCMPPFAFTGLSGNLPTSGHWGGPIQDNDPDIFGRQISVSSNVNLWALAAERLLPPETLSCPSAPAPLLHGSASLFPYTTKFSTYCLRFPLSDDLFDESPKLSNYRNLGLLGVYLFHCGGQDAPIVPRPVSGTFQQTVPMVRLGRQYRLEAVVRFGKSTFDPSCDAVVSDGFWRQGFSSPAPPPRRGETTFPVNWGWSHGTEFNVLYGGGAVKCVTDDGVIRDNTLQAGKQFQDDKNYFATHSERIWQFFDDPHTR